MAQVDIVVLVVAATLAFKRRLLSIADTIIPDRRGNCVTVMQSLTKHLSVVSKMSINIDIVVIRKCDIDIEFKSLASAHLYPILRSLCQIANAARRCLYNDMLSWVGHQWTAAVAADDDDDDDAAS